MIFPVLVDGTRTALHLHLKTPRLRSAERAATSAKGSSTERNKSGKVTKSKSRKLQRSSCRSHTTNLESAVST